MVWCSNCAKNITRPDTVEGKICCSLCGRVLDEDNFSQEPTFVKNAAGQSQLSGSYVRTVQNEISVSRERTLNEAYDGIDGIMCALGIDGGDSIARPALALYTIAVERNFTRGRRKEQVQAACLYIACREEKKPYLRIDFSEHLRINVYVLGAVFLQLCKLLSLEENAIIQKPVDPSLFIHRFTDRLFGGKKLGVSKTALQIIASMKRDWMQTGRKPSGLCGAALYISALSHGLKCSKYEIIKVVHVSEATLYKRLIEIENTESGGLTIDEFNMKADELENEERLITSLNTGSKASVVNKLLCEHKNSEKPPFAHGLCKECYEEFIKLSGGLNAGSEPPSFQRAEMERLVAKEAAAKRSKNSDSSALPGQAENGSNRLNSCVCVCSIAVQGAKPMMAQGACLWDTIILKEKKLRARARCTAPAFSALRRSGPKSPRAPGAPLTAMSDEQRRINNTSGNEVLKSAESSSTGATGQHKITIDSSKVGIHEADATFKESESLSDVEDIDVDFYLLQSEEEKSMRKYIWEKMNKEYLKEQAVKEAVAMAKRKAEEENSSTCSGDVQAAKMLSAAADEAAAKSRKEKRQQRAAELKNAGPAQTAHEATKQVLEKKRLSSKVRYGELEKLFNEDLSNAKKSQTEHLDHDDNYNPNNSKDGSEVEDMNDAYDDGNLKYSYDGNVKAYNYDDY